MYCGMQRIVMLAKSVGVHSVLRDATYCDVGQVSGGT